MSSPSLDQHTDSTGNTDYDADIATEVHQLQTLCEEASVHLTEDDWTELRPPGNVDHLDAAGRALLARYVRARMLKRMEESAGNNSVEPEAEEEEGVVATAAECEEYQEEEDTALGSAGGKVKAVNAAAHNIEYMPLSDVQEPFVVAYSSQTYGVPKKSVLVTGKPMEFGSAELMSKKITSKSPGEWNQFLTKHITVVESTTRLKPKGWYDGKDGKQETDLPFERFYYVTAFVTPDPSDYESMRKAEYDKRRLHHVFVCVSTNMNQRFNKLTTLSDDRKTMLKPVIEWSPPKNPQVNPQVAGWPRYDRLKLYSAFVRPTSTTRIKGPHYCRGVKATSLSNKRAADEGSSSSANATDHVEEYDEGGEDQMDFHVCGRYKRFRQVKLADAAKAQVFIANGHAYIIEF